MTLNLGRCGSLPLLVVFLSLSFPQIGTTQNETDFECSGGFYLLDSLGGRHRVGNPPVIEGPLMFGQSIARDLEKAVAYLPGGTAEQLTVLDAYGAVHFVAYTDPGIPQDFHFEADPSFPQGRAVDLVMTVDSLGYWVLTDFGGVFRAGTAKDPEESAQVPDPSGIASHLGWDVPLSGSLRAPTLPDPGGATLRAVSLVVFDLDGDSRAEGYIIMDSIGGRYHLDAEGNRVPRGYSAGSLPNEPVRLLDPDAYSWPIFRGLDIARDMEPHSTLMGLVVLDGWGGIHPVPEEEESNPVFFARNEVSLSDPTPRQSLGMPYIIYAWDDPTTEADESDTDEFGIDVESIFTDLEFTVGFEGGFYTLDKFGAVFALGSARLDPTKPYPLYGSSPYFFPFLFAEDLEFFGPEPGSETCFFGRPLALASFTPRPTNTITETPTATSTRTPLPTGTTAPTRTITLTPTVTATPTITGTPTESRTPTPTRTFPPTPTVPPTPPPDLDLGFDLDRFDPGIQSSLLTDREPQLIQGSVVMTQGHEGDTVGRYAIKVDLVGDAVIIPGQSSLGPGEIPDGDLGLQDTITPRSFSRANLFGTEVPILNSSIRVFDFNLMVSCESPADIHLSLVESATNPQVGIRYNGYPLEIGSSRLRYLAVSPGNITCDPLPTYTPAPACDDSGFYLLDAFGGRHQVGSPASILGSLYYGNDAARDLETVQSGDTIVTPVDLAVLDRFGAVQFVSNPANAPGPGVYFPEGSNPVCGYAVDVEMTRDGLGCYVLTEAGGIFRVGSAKPSADPFQLGNDAAALCDMLDIPFGDMRHPAFPSTDNARLRAVGFAVVQPQGEPVRYVVIDSQGGRYVFDEAGFAFSGEGFLADDAAYPFFPGLDIVRDIELHPFVNHESGNGSVIHGLVILDGFGGVHPVPPGFREGSSVSFVQNIAPAQQLDPGLPYIPFGFNDPATPQNEGNPALFGADANSIFRDIEFCTTGDGVYTMDAFGAVFAYGNTRAAPGSLDTMFTGAPYFFPNLYARDLEPSR